MGPMASFAFFDIYGFFSTMDSNLRSHEFFYIYDVFFQQCTNRCAQPLITQ